MMLRNFALAVLLSTVSWMVSQADEQKSLQADGAVRISNILGMNVRNEAGEDLGKVEDLVLDAKSGKLRYAALSHGGFLGIGDKLFAVPWEQFSLLHRADDDQRFLVLNVSKDALENAPGFNKDAWPNMADRDWAKRIEEYYRTAREREATRVR